MSQPILIIIGLLAMTPLAIVALRAVDRRIRRRQQLAYLSGPLRDQLFCVATDEDERLIEFPMFDTETATSAVLWDDKPEVSPNRPR